MAIVRPARPGYGGYPNAAFTLVTKVRLPYLPDF
jgi:hypothetical protein